jgi:hypothetical protein
MHLLQDRVDFEPRFVTWSCPYCSDDFKGGECYGDGKYCAPNHERSAFTKIVGRTIIDEDLRQYCLHANLKAKGQEALWWDYVKYVHQECYDLIDQSCSRLGHKFIGEKLEETL